MKVLLAFPIADKQTGLYIKKSFEQLGHEVSVCDAKTEPQKLFDIESCNVRLTTFSKSQGTCVERRKIAKEAIF